MASQSTAIISTNNATITGTKPRYIAMNQAAIIIPQNNPITALRGGKYIGPDGVTEKTAPAVIATKKAKRSLVECFSNQLRPQTFTIASGATAAGTSIDVQPGDGASILNGEFFSVNETRDVFYVNADPSTDTLTIVRYSGSNVISVGHNITKLGYSRGELSSNPEFIMRLNDQYQNFTTIQEEAFRSSERENNEERYSGPTFEQQRKLKMYELIRACDNAMIAGKENSGVGTGSTTTSRGLIDWATNGNGKTFDFGGTVERTEIRDFGTALVEFTSYDLIGVTSEETIGNFSSIMDDSKRVTESEYGKALGWSNIEKMKMGPATVHWFPHNFFAQAGNLGSGVIFDPKKCPIYELSQMKLYEVEPFSDSTLTSDKRGLWRYDGGCILPNDGGFNVSYFTGADAAI